MGKVAWGGRVVGGLGGAVVFLGMGMGGGEGNVDVAEGHCSGWSDSGVAQVERMMLAVIRRR